MCGGWPGCLEASKDCRTGLQLTPHSSVWLAGSTGGSTDEDLAVSSGGCSSMFDCQEPVRLSESDGGWSC